MGGRVHAFRKSWRPRGPRSQVLPCLSASAAPSRGAPGPSPAVACEGRQGRVGDCGALAPAHSGGGTALPEPSVPTMVWSSNHPKERRGGHLVQAPGRSTWTGPCERVCRPLAVPGPPHQRSSADTQGCSQPPPCQPLGRQAAAGDAVGTGGDQAVPTAAFPKHRMNF